MQLVDRIHLQDNLDYFGLQFFIGFQLHLLYYTRKKKKKLSAYLVCAITFCNAHLEVALKRSVVLTTKSENYRK